jgi:hypothetical protein
VNLLRENFPEALHVGLIRNPNDQFKSWLEQFALGNTAFFDIALNFINQDIEFFKTKLDPLKAKPQEIFEVYYSQLITLRPELDVIHNIYEESFDDLVKKLPSGFHRAKFISIAEKYNNIPPRISIDQKLVRMMDRSIELTQQRDELINSTIWKISQPLRFLINAFKRSLKRQD